MARNTRNYTPDEKRILAKGYQDLRGFVNGFRAVQKGFLWGFLDEKDKPITKFIYTMVEDFNEEGFAKVTREGTYRNETRGWQGVINSEGIETIKCNNNLVFLSKDKIARRAVGEFYVYTCQVTGEDITKKFPHAKDFYNGFARVSQDGEKWTSINKKGQPATNLENLYALVGEMQQLKVEGFDLDTDKEVEKMGADFAYLLTPHLEALQEERKHGPRKFVPKMLED